MSSVPFARYLFFFVFGIHVAGYIPFWITCICPLFSALVVIWYSRSKDSLRYKSKTIIALLLFLTLFAFGGFIGHTRLPIHFQDHYAKQITKEKVNTGVLFQQTEEWSKGKFNQKSTVELLAIETPYGWKKCSGSIRIKSTAKHVPAIGSKNIAFAEISEIRKPINPIGKDYTTSWKKKGITHQANVIGEIKTLEEASYYSPDQIRKHLWRSMQLRLKDSLSLSLVSALVIGERSDMPQEIIQAFSATGTIHVLSVSGMHVGLIFLVLNTLFRKEKWTGKKIAIKTIIMLAALWCYALVTGFSPSVLRAVAMLSLIVFGQAILMRTNIYNILSASAFLLLCYDASLLYNAGFQLSYLAVAGIALFHPFVSALWIPKNKWIDKIWQLCSVSFSAQLATFPLALYHFGTFPNYFLITNLIIIPISTVILFGGIILLLTFWIPWIGQAVAWALEQLVSFLAGLVIQFAALPGAVTEIQIDFTECLLLYGFIIFLFLAFRQYLKKNLLLTLGFLSLLIAKHTFSYRHSEEIILYADRNKVLVHHRSPYRNHLLSIGKKEEYFVEIQLARQEHQLLKYALSPENLVALQHQTKTHFFKGPCMDFGELFVLIAGSGIHPEKPMQCDVLLVSGLFHYASVKELEYIQPRVVVLDLSCGVTRKEKWKNGCRQKGIHVLDMAETGALKFSF